MSGTLLAAEPISPVPVEARSRQQSDATVRIKDIADSPHDAISAWWASRLEIEDAEIVRLEAEAALLDWRSEQVRELARAGHASWRETAAVELAAAQQETRLRSARQFRTWMGTIIGEAATRLVALPSSAWEWEWLAADSGIGSSDWRSLTDNDRDIVTTTLLQLAELRGSPTALGAAQAEFDLRERQCSRLEAMPMGTANANEVERSRLERNLAERVRDRAVCVQRHFQNEATLLRIKIAKLSRDGAESQSPKLASQTLVEPLPLNLIAGPANLLSAETVVHGSAAIAAKYRQLRFDSIAALHAEGHASRLELELALWEHEQSRAAVTQPTETTARKSDASRNETLVREVSRGIDAPLGEDVWSDGAAVVRAMTERRHLRDVFVEMDINRLELAFQREVARRLEHAGATRELELHRVAVEFLEARRGEIELKLASCQIDLAGPTEATRSRLLSKADRARAIAALQTELNLSPVTELNRQLQRTIRRSTAVHELRRLGQASVSEVEQATLAVTLVKSRIRMAEERDAVSRCELMLLKLIGES